MSALEELKNFTKIVADTGDFESIQKYKPLDSTTNPSLIYAAAGLPQYQNLVNDAIEYGKSHGGVEAALMKLAVDFGVEILKIVPGRVSTEVDARLSYDTAANIHKAREIIKLYKEAGIEKERVLIKIASTWEGIQAARELEKEGIHCNLTLLFSLTQAAACADAGVTLISPFVGRITDFFKAKEKRDFGPEEDPGVLSVRRIFNYLKKYGYKTQVMGASFRTKEQVTALAGCDLLTISPAILEQLAHHNAPVTKHLDIHHPVSDVAQFIPDEHFFKQEVAKDEMASFKLDEGIKKFTDDLIKLEKIISEKLAH